MLAGDEACFMHRGLLVGDLIFIGDGLGEEIIDSFVQVVVIIIPGG